MTEGGTRHQRRRQGWLESHNVSDCTQDVARAAETSPSRSIQTSSEQPSVPRDGNILEIAQVDCTGGTAQFSASCLVLVGYLAHTSDFTQYLLNDPHAPMVTVSLEE